MDDTKNKLRQREVAAFTTAFFEELGGTVARDEPEGITVDVPPRLTEALGPERLSLRFAPSSEEGCALVAPGSRTFDAMLDWLRKRGEVAWVPLDKKHSEIACLPDDVGPLSSFGLVAEPKRTTAYEVELLARVAFVAEERDEELVLVFVPAHGEPSVLDNSEIERLCDQALVADDSPLEHPTKKRVREILATAEATLDTWARNAARSREEVLLEHLTREVQQLTGYFGELIAQNELDDLLREQLAKELDRRVAEEVSNHVLGLSIDVLSYAIVARPQIEFAFRFQCGADEVPASWHYDLPTGTFIAPLCPVCGEPARHATVCEEERHVCCDGCGDACESCGVSVCADHGLVHCHIGGETLCASCGPRCDVCGKPTRRRRLRPRDAGLCCPECSPR